MNFEIMYSVEIFYWNGQDTAEKSYFTKTSGLYLGGRCVEMELCAVPRISRFYFITLLLTLVLILSDS